jgi:predicted adenine nucleotide alpha hydrolase (AANH) superfamily ATPase
MTSINKSNVFSIFQDADNSQASFASRLYDEGVFDKAQAIPLVIEFIEGKYEGAKAYMGQRGMTFEKDTAPHTAMKRILNNCFETVKTPSAEKAKKDEVELLLAKIKKLSKTDQKRIKDAI